MSRCEIVPWQKGQMLRIYFHLVFYMRCMLYFWCWQRFGVLEDAGTSVFITGKWHYHPQQSRSCYFHLVHRDFPEYRAHYLPGSLIWWLRSKPSSFMPKISFLRSFSALEVFGSTIIILACILYFQMRFERMFYRFSSLLSFLYLRSLLII